MSGAFGLVVVVLALAGGCFAVGRRTPPSPGPGLRSFLLTGAPALVLLAVVAVVLALAGRPDRASGLVVVGLFGYLGYLLLALLLTARLSAAAPDAPPDRWPRLPWPLRRRRPPAG